MKIKKCPPPQDQMCSLGNHSWSASRLIWESRNLPVMEIPLDHINLYCKYENLTLRDMVMHMQAVEDSDLDMPIILDEDGEIMDGRHRLMKAMLRGKETIKAVRFDENPSPCKVKE